MIKVIRAIAIWFVSEGNDLACAMTVAKPDAQTLRGLGPMPVSNTDQKKIIITL